MVVDEAGVSLNVAGLAGNVLNVAVCVGTVGTGCRVGTYLIKTGMTGDTFHFAAASQVVGRAKVRAAADGLVVLEDVTFLALNV